MILMIKETNFVIYYFISILSQYYLVGANLAIDKFELSQN